MVRSRKLSKSPSVDKKHHVNKKTDRSVGVTHENNNNNRDNNPQTDARMCRVCHDGETESNRLYYPCNCIGTVKYIHESCLTHWLTISKNEKCELCNCKFTFENVYHDDVKQVSVLVVMREALQQLLRGVKLIFHFLAFVVVFIVLVPLTSIAVLKLGNYAVNQLWYIVSGSESHVVNFEFYQLVFLISLFCLLVDTVDRVVLNHARNGLQNGLRVRQEPVIFITSIRGFYTRFRTRVIEDLVFLFFIHILPFMFGKVFVQAFRAVIVATSRSPPRTTTTTTALLMLCKASLLPFHVTTMHLHGACSKNEERILYDDDGNESELLGASISNLELLVGWSFFLIVFALYSIRYHWETVKSTLILVVNLSLYATCMVINFSFIPWLVGTVFVQSLFDWVNPKDLIAFFEVSDPHMAFVHSNYIININIGILLILLITLVEESVVLKLFHPALMKNFSVVGKKLGSLISSYAEDRQLRLNNRINLKRFEPDFLFNHAMFAMRCSSHIGYYTSIVRVFLSIPWVFYVFVFNFERFSLNSMFMDINDKNETILLPLTAAFKDGVTGRLEVKFRTVLFVLFFSLLDMITFHLSVPTLLEAVPKFFAGFRKLARWFRVEATLLSCEIPNASLTGCSISQSQVLVAPRDYYAPSTNNTNNAFQYNVEDVSPAMAEDWPFALNQATDSFLYKLAHAKRLVNFGQGYLIGCFSNYNAEVGGPLFIYYIPPWKVCVVITAEAGFQPPLDLIQCAGEMRKANKPCVVLRDVLVGNDSVYGGMTIKLVKNVSKIVGMRERDASFELLRNGNFVSVNMFHQIEFNQQVTVRVLAFCFTAMVLVSCFAGFCLLVLPVTIGRRLEQARFSSYLFHHGGSGGRYLVVSDCIKWLWGWLGMLSSLACLEVVPFVLRGVRNSIRLRRVRSDAVYLLRVVSLLVLLGVYIPSLIGFLGKATFIPNHSGPLMLTFNSTLSSVAYYRNNDSISSNFTENNQTIINNNSSDGNINQFVFDFDFSVFWLAGLLSFGLYGSVISLGGGGETHPYKESLDRLFSDGLSNAATNLFCLKHLAIPLSTYLSARCFLPYAFASVLEHYGENELIGRLLQWCGKENVYYLVFVLEAVKEFALEAKGYFDQVRTDLINDRFLLRRELRNKEE